MGINLEYFSLTESWCKIGHFLFQKGPSTSLAEKILFPDPEPKPWQPFWEYVLKDKLGQSAEAA